MTVSCWACTRPATHHCAKCVAHKETDIADHDPQLLCLDRGEGKTTAIIKSIAALPRKELGRGAAHGIVLLPTHSRAQEFARAAERHRYGRQLDQNHVLIGGARIFVTSEPLIDHLRGCDRRMPVWIDDAGDFISPAIELVHRAGLDRIILATFSPRPPHSPASAPAAYNPRLIRHQLSRVARPYPVQLEHPLGLPSLTGYLAEATREGGSS